MTKDITKKNRIEWIDCAKGITICLVVIGHTVARSNDLDPENLIRGVIFSFHMPLFFVFSGYTMKLSNSADELTSRMEKSVRRLLVPAIIIFLLLRVYYLFLNGWNAGISKKQYAAETINILVYSSGMEIRSLGIPAIGVLWFLVAMFFAKTMYDYLHFRLSNEWFMLACCILSLIGVLFGVVQWLPFSFDLSLAVLVFFLFGTLLRKLDITRHSVLRMVLLLFIWAGLFIIVFRSSDHYLEFATREYPLFPLSYVCAAAGVLFVSYVAYYLSKIPVLSKALLFLGENTMTIYCVHAADGVISSLWSVTDSNILNSIIRLCLVLLISCVIIRGKSIARNYARSKKPEGE